MVEGWRDEAHLKGPEVCGVGRATTDQDRAGEDQCAKAELERINVPRRSWRPEDPRQIHGAEWRKQKRS